MISIFDCQQQKTISMDCVDDSGKTGLGADETVKVLFEDSSEPFSSGATDAAGLPSSPACQGAAQALAEAPACTSTPAGLQALSCGTGKMASSSSKQPSVSLYPSCSALSALQRLNECIGCPESTPFNGKNLDSEKSAQGASVKGDADRLSKCFDVVGAESVLTEEKDPFAPLLKKFDTAASGFDSDSAGSGSSSVGMAVPALSLNTPGMAGKSAFMRLEMPGNFIRNTLDHTALRTGFKAAASVANKYGLQCDPQKLNCSADLLSFLYAGARAQGYDIVKELQELKLKVDGGASKSTGGSNGNSSDS